MKQAQSKLAVNSLSLGSIQSSITRYGSRHWAVYLNGKLLAVTVYKKGALAVQDALLSHSQSIEKRSTAGQTLGSAT